MRADTVDDKELYAGLIRLHILHHAIHEPIFGLGIIEELARHGYKLSAGTLYPLLHGLEQKGYLRSYEERNGRWARKLYRATPLGRKALEAAKEKVRELFGELFEDPPQLIHTRRSSSRNVASRRSGRSASLQTVG
jgi:DNA-binding PadR family transcriptional regulator